MNADIVVHKHRTQSEVFARTKKGRDFIEENYDLLNSNKMLTELVDEFVEDCRKYDSSILIEVI